MKEIWKKIDEKEIYEVSNLGGFCNGIEKNYANNLFTTRNYKENRGGFRPNSGRKKLNYETKQMGVRVPVEIFKKCVEFCKKETKNFEKSLQVSK